MTELQEINLGAGPDDGTGDNIRAGGEKIKANFTELDKRTKRVEFGTLQIFKAQGNTLTTLENGDKFKGLWYGENWVNPTDSNITVDTNQMIEGTFNGGDPTDLANYNIVNTY